MKRYRLVEANRKFLNDEFFIESQLLMITEAEANTQVNKLFSSVANNTSTLDWAKVEKGLGNPVPEEIRAKVEEYCGGKSFKWRKILQILMMASVSIFILFAAYTQAKYVFGSGFSSLTPNGTLLMLFGGFLAVLLNILAYMIVKKISNQKLQKTEIFKFIKHVDPKNPNINKAWDAILDGYNKKHETSDKIFQGTVLFMMIAFLLGALVLTGSSIASMFIH